MTIDLGSMREDVDYVTFGNYSADMDELSQRSAAIIRQLRRERDEAKRLMLCVLRAAGGDVRFPSQWLQDGPPEGELIQDRYDDDMTVRLRMTLAGIVASVGM